jgi:hypothetical protein
MEDPQCKARAFGQRLEFAWIWWRGRGRMTPQKDRANDRANYAIMTYN